MSEYEAGASSRLQSLDVVRGLLVSLVLFTYVAWDQSAFGDWINHAGWNGGKQGIGLSDVFLPWFLFVAGVAIPFTISQQRKASFTRLQYLRFAFRRCAVLYLLGCLLVAARSAYSYAKPLDFSCLVAWDDVQYIAFAYLIAYFFYFCPLKFRVAFIAIVFAIQWMWLTCIPIPGTFELVWTPSHSTHAWLYEQIGWCAGFQNVLPAACVAMLGSMVGTVIRCDRLSFDRRFYVLTIGGVGAILVALLWQLHLPLSQRYFTGSYALLSAGIATAIVAVAHKMFDASPSRFSMFVSQWAIPLGRNTILFTCAVEFIWLTILCRWLVLYPNGMTGALIGGVLAWIQNTLGNILGAWAFAVGYVLFWWSVAMFLHRRRLFLSV